VRKQILTRDAWQCQIKGRNCKGRANQVDHIVPFEEAPHLRLEPSNLRASCSSCNQDRTHATKAEGWRRARTKITLVAGPPGSGKTTFVEQNAGPNDLVVDFDLIAEAMGSSRSHDHERTHSEAAGAARNAILKRLQRGQVGAQRAWIVSANPNAEAMFPHHSVHLIDPGIDEVKRRAHTAGRPAKWLDLIDDWYLKRASVGAPAPVNSRQW
jgi:hypothetical protein